MITSSFSTGSKPESIFVPEREVRDVNDCVFYHTINLPGYGVIPGAWDLRDCVDAYLGHVPLKGKRVLELGTANGFLCFEMEKRGAEVVGYDLSEQQDWDIVPFDKSSQPSLASERKNHIRQLNNGWWLAHQAFQSNAKVVYGSIYEIPKDIGTFDVGTFGCILLHLRDPFLALATAAKHVEDTIIVTEHDCHWHPCSLNLESYRPAPRRIRGKILYWMHKLLGDKNWLEREDRHRMLYDMVNTLPLSLFLPNAKEGRPNDTWWYLRPNTIIEMLGVLGFRNAKVTNFTTLFNQQPQQMFTIVAHRDSKTPSTTPWRLASMIKEVASQQKD